MKFYYFYTKYLYLLKFKNKPIFICKKKKKTYYICPCKVATIQGTPPNPAAML